MSLLVDRCFCFMIPRCGMLAPLPGLPPEIQWGISVLLFPHVWSKAYETKQKISRKIDQNFYVFLEL